MFGMTRSQRCPTGGTAVANGGQLPTVDVRLYPWFEACSPDGFTWRGTPIYNPRQSVTDIKPVQVL